MRRDYAIVASNSQHLILHAADCPKVRALAAKGVPVMTLLGCLERPEIRAQHDCVEKMEGG